MTSTASADAEKPTENLPFKDTLGVEVVNLVVGPKRKEFSVHKKLICDSCDYFQKAFNGLFLEGVEGKIYMTEDSPDAVGLFVEWLYRRTILLNRTHTQFNALIKLYLLSEKWCLYDLGNAVIDAIKQYFWISPDRPSHMDYLLPDVVSYIWSQTQEDSPLRKLCIERLAWIYSDETILNIVPGKDSLTKLWANFNHGLKPRNPGRTPTHRGWIYDVCSFHYHAEGQKCLKNTEAAKEKKQDESEYDDFFADLTEK